MGYDIIVIREEEKDKISQKAWLQYLKNDKDFRLTESNGEMVAIWILDDVNAPFRYYEEFGMISVKNPDTWVIEKMISIADELDAVVKGEEGEIYDQNYIDKEDKDGRLYLNTVSEWPEPKSISVSVKENISKRKWWQFWK
ncbi:MAG: hypothetical protein CMO01_14560 [Thalassobius sp.]|nr:hypothetical protein [Thalassovita sp.]